KARKAVLTHAVRSLTIKRASSPLVTTRKFGLLLDYCLEQFSMYVIPDLAEPMRAVKEQWRTRHKSRVSKRTASELKVLYLCGPEPLNDLEELLELGVAQENIWAVEGHDSSYRAAVSQLRGHHVKLHNGSLSDLFEVVPEQFDIVYFDSC